MRRHSERKTDIIDATKCIPKPSKKRTQKRSPLPCPFTAHVSGRDGTHVRFNLNDELEAFGVILEMKDEYLIEIKFHMISTDGTPLGKGKATWKHWKLLLVPLASMDTNITKYCLSLRAQLDVQVRHYNILLKIVNNLISYIFHIFL